MAVQEKIEKGEKSGIRNNTDSVLLDVAIDVLGYEELTIDDDLYDYGMDSLMVLMICSRMKSEPGNTMTLRALYGINTIRGISDSLETINETAKQPAETTTAPQKNVEDLLNEL